MIERADVAPDTRLSAARWPSVAAAVFGFAWFLELGGKTILNPFNVRWLLKDDWMQHWFGFLFFQREPWTFPLGTVDGLLYPIGTNIAFTDSNPLVSMVLKPFAGWLPAEYQVMGLWLAACFVLQGYIGARLASVATKDAAEQAVGGMLFVMSPALAFRVGHDTLCAHWLLLGMCYLGLREYADDRGARRAVLLAGAAVAFAAGTHPYLAVMCWLLGLALYARFWRTRRLTASYVAVAGVATTAVMLAIFTAIGYFGGVKLEQGGFGLFSADVLALVNPDRFSRLLHSQPTHPGQYEGFAFLGLGGLLAVLAGIGLLVKRRPRLPAGAWLVVAAAVMMALFALSSVITYQGRAILSLQWLYRPIEMLTAPFRSSGRFIWPLHYLALLFGIWGVTRMTGAARGSAGTALLAMLVVLQGVDFKIDPTSFESKALAGPPAFVVDRLGGRFRHLALYPTQVPGACGPAHDVDKVYHYMWMALRLQTTYNSGRFARLPEAAAREECARLDRSVTEGTLDPQTLFVLVSDQYLERFRLAGAVCRRLTGDWYCVSKDSDPAIRQLLERQ